MILTVRGAWLKAARAEAARIARQDRGEVRPQRRPVEDRQPDPQARDALQVRRHQQDQPKQRDRMNRQGEQPEEPDKGECNDQAAEA